MEHMPLDASVMAAVDTDSRVAHDSLRCGRYPGWAVIHTHPQAERWACDGLNRAGYRTFLPLYTAKRRDPVLRTMTRSVELPLFTSYAFVLLGQHDPWVPIRYTPGVHSLLMSGGQPNIAAMASIEALEASQELRLAVAPPGASWASGSVLEVSRGSFSGHRGALLRLLTKDRAVVMLLLFGELREVVVPIADLTADFAG
jgi:transcription antitermination factor NusG